MVCYEIRVDLIGFYIGLLSDVLFLLWTRSDLNMYDLLFFIVKLLYER